MSDRLSLKSACRSLAEGGVIIYPTETLWGIGGDARLAEVAARVLKAKGIDLPRPFPVLADTVERALAVAEPVPGLDLLAGRFWPGSVTLVVPVRDETLARTAGQGGRVGLRVCSLPQVARLAASCGGFLLSTSANLTGDPPPLSLAEVSMELRRRVDGCLAWSGICGGLPSTVVAWEPQGWAVVREGAVPLAEVARLVTVEETL